MSRGPLHIEVSKFDQEKMPQLQTADQPTAQRERHRIQTATTQSNAISSLFPSRMIAKLEHNTKNLYIIEATKNNSYIRITALERSAANTAMGLKKIYHGIFGLDYNTK